MAYRPSMRSSRGMVDVEPNITPMMNLMVVLIPLLLSSAELIKIGVIELNLPPATAGLGPGAELPKETERRLDLAVTITDQGFTISSSLAILKGESGEGPSIPLLPGGAYDYGRLSEMLHDIKKKAEGRFSDTERVIIQAEPRIVYQIIVSTMDAARATTKNGNVIRLFPEVSLSAGIV